MKSADERITFIEMPSADLVKYLIDVQHPYLFKAFSAFTLCGKTISDSLIAEPGSKILTDLLQKLETLVRAHFEQDKEFFDCLGLISQNKAVDKLTPMLTNIRKQHAAILRVFKKLRLLINDYKAPKNAPATIKLCYAQLFNFEQDMLKHIFLEGDILFPKLLAMNKYLTNR